MDKILNVIKYCGPQTYYDFQLQGFQGKEIELDRLVYKGILTKKNGYYKIEK